MASEYYPWAMDFTLPAPVPGYQKYQVNNRCHSIAHQNTVETWSYTVPYDHVEEFIATVNGGGRTPRPGAAKKPPVVSKINRRVTG